MIKITCFILSLFLILSCSNGEDEKVNELMNKGTQFLDNKNYSSALVCFKDIQKHKQSEEQQSKNYRNIAVVFLYMNEIDSAKYYSQMGFRCVDPSSYYHLLNKGEYYLLTNQVKKAISIFEKAKNIEPNEIEVYNNLSLIYAGNYGEQFFDLDLALKYALKAYRIKKIPVNQEQLASVYFQKENFQKAAKLFKDLYENHPEAKIYQFNYGQSLYFMGKENQGIELMKNAAERDEICRKMFDKLVDVN